MDIITRPDGVVIIDLKGQSLIINNTVTSKPVIDPDTNEQVGDTPNGMVSISCGDDNTFPNLSFGANGYWEIGTVNALLTSENLPKLLALIKE